MADRVIYRYEFEAEGETLYVQGGLVINARTIESDRIEVWVLHTIESARGRGTHPTMGIRAFGTGKIIPEGWQYLTTCDPVPVFETERVVWHLFKEPEPYDPEDDEEF